jgi:hypothetical protein
MWGLRDGRYSARVRSVPERAAYRSEPADMPVKLESVVRCGRSNNLLALIRAGGLATQMTNLVPADQ